MSAAVYSGGPWGYGGGGGGGAGFARPRPVSTARAASRRTPSHPKACLALSGVAASITREYFKRKK